MSGRSSYKQWRQRWTSAEGMAARPDSRACRYLTSGCSSSSATSSSRELS